MLLAPASIGRKLMIAFLSMAGLLILAVTIGASGFTLVAQTERKVVNAAIPAMVEAREVAGLSSRIISSVEVLSNAQTELQRKKSGHHLFSQLEKLLNHIQQLGKDSFDSELLDELEANAQHVIDTIAQLGISVEQKLALEHELALRIDDMRQFSGELEELTRTQVRNTSTIAVANVTQLYELIERQEQEKVYDALDTLVEVDLDLAERLHELHLLAFQILAHIEESQTVSDFDRIQQIRTEFANNLSIMQQRVLSVEDPARSEQMTELLNQLAERQVVFEILNKRFETNETSIRLKEQTLKDFEALNATVNELIDESNRVTADAVDEVTTTLLYAKWTLVILSLLGLVAVSFSVWKIVYKDVVIRLHDYSDALRNIAKGKVEFELETKGKDEIAKMGRAIVTARDTAKQLQIVAESEAKAKQDLEQHKTHLEDTVKERTSQLSLANDKLNEEVEQHAKAREEAEQANRAKSAFLSTMSHEIRTPMNGVLGTATLLKSTGLNAKQSYYVDVINRSGSNLLAILNDVLDYSKIEAGHLEIRRSPIQLSELVKDIFQLLESRAKEKGIGFHRMLENDVLGYWEGDATRIGQVLNNLLGNAIKFTHTGDIDLYVSIDPYRENHILFEVSDTGIGIAQEDVKHLFNVFSQLGSEEAKMGGTGLGLAISEKIVQAMDGVIGVESELGAGSRFWFSVPMFSAEKPETETREPVRSTKARAKIFMVEDNPVNCLVAEGFLSLEGHEVFIAEDGASAVKLYTEQKFDIALLDINLPDCNGVELLSRLKKLQPNVKTPFVAISAHVFSEDVENYLKAGFDAYIPKPLDKHQLSETIQHCLNGKALLLEQASIEPESLTPNANERSEIGDNTDTALINFKVLEGDKAVLGEDKIRKLISMFVTSSSEIISATEKAYECRDVAQVKQMAHKLKGSAGSMGMTKLYELCYEVESASCPDDKYAELRSALNETLQLSVLAVQKRFRA